MPHMVASFVGMRKEHVTTGMVVRIHTFILVFNVVVSLRLISEREKARISAPRSERFILRPRHFVSSSTILLPERPKD
jgi:hypothetical protein